MKYVATQRSGVKVFLLIAVLLALCFALSGCFEVYTVADYNPGHVHTYEIGDNDDDMQIRCGVPVLYLYEQLPDAFTDSVDPYNENEIIDVKNNDIVAACGEIYPEYEMYHCTGCGTLIWRPNGQTRVLEHDWEEWEPFHEATCTEPQEDVRSCIRCGEEEYRSVGKPLGHDYESDDAVPATCTEDGRKANKKCKRCGHMHSGEVIPAPGHDFVQHGAQAATCTTVGWDAYVTCSRCNYTTYVEKAALGHDWGDATYTWSDDRGKCTANRVCKRDGNHVETETADVTLQMTGNTCTGGVTTYSATFTNPAFVAQSDTVAFDGVGHSEEIIPGVPATCVKNGLSEGKICLVCWEFLVEQGKTDKDPNNHEGPFVLGLNADVPSTCTTPGYHTEGICKACGVEVKTELPLDSDNHGKVVVLPAEPATCVSTGLTEGMKCAGCGKILVEQKETDKDPNNHEGPMALVSNADVPSTCTTPGYHTERICKACGVEVKTELPLDPDNHGKVVVLPAVPATCTQTGLTEGTKCAACGKVLSGLIETPVDPYNHDWGEWMQTKAPNCTEAGTETRSCGREGCEAKETREVAALGHTGTATCTAQAVCTRCNQPYGKALGHNWGTATYTWSADYSQCSAERECGRCHKGENATADALAEGTPATCEQAGKTTYTATFSDPFTTQTVSKETPALGHKGGTATCTAKAVCTRCNQPYGDPMGHDIVHHEAQAPTCTAPGWDTYDTCSRCDYTTTYAETDALGHLGEWMQTKAPNCTDPGEKIRSCQRAGCGATETELIPPVEGAHVAVVDPAVAATCVEEGKTEGSHCSVCGKVLVEQTATEKNPNNHAALERIGAEPATCDKSGFTGTLVCKACKLDGDYTRISEGVIIPALEHEYNDKGVCARCGKSKEPEVVSGGNS